MKKNIKLKTILVAASFILLQTQVLADPIVEAINLLRTEEFINAINGTANTSMVNQIVGLNTQMTKLFDDTFKGTFNKNTGKLENLGTIDTKIDLYANNFYSWYSTKVFPNLGFKEISEKNNNSVQKLLTQEIGYNTQRSIDKKIGDMGMLLSQPIEKDNNNITAENLGINSNDKTITPYGSLDSSLSPVASNTPTVDDLIGPDTYDDTTSNKAKLFISYILRTSLPPKTFYIPSENEAVGTGENRAVSVYLPIPSTDAPYTTVSVSTNKNSSGQSEYTRMVNYLNTNARYYQPYKMKTRATNILRTLYIENLFNLYQERTKEKIKGKDGKETEGSKSLVEKEKDEAFAGLDKKYYEDLKTKSAADVNLEMLRAINKLSYFVYKLHQDNERSTLIMAASGLQLAGQNSQDDSAYVNPISTLIKNKCWAPTEATQGICDNPSNPSMTQH